MESVFGGPVQSEDNEASQSSPACLRVPLILRKVMEHFSNKELIQYSTVDKQWNYEARSLMMYRGNNIATLRGHSQHDLAVFASRVRQMSVVPFCGIGIRMDAEDHQVICQPSSSETLDPSFHVILDRLRWTCFKVCYSDQWESDTQCPAFVLAKKILHDFCGVLEHLVLGVFDNHGEFFKQVLRDCTFPRLKVLFLIGRFSDPLEMEEKHFIKTVVSRCPNLQQLHLDAGLIDLTENLLEGSSAMLVVESDIDPYNDVICEDLLGSLKLKRIVLDYANGDFSIERFNRNVPVVLQASRAELYSLSFNLMFAVSLMRYGIRLENVIELAIPMKSYLRLYTAPLPMSQYCMDLSPFCRNLKNFNFTLIFPKFTKVAILDYRRESGWAMSQFIEQGNSTPKEPALDRAVNFKHLTLKNESANVPFLAFMFPDIETLKVDNFYGQGPPYELIWEHWIHLKKLVIHLNFAWSRNVDSVFCGIFPDEVAELREKDDEYLKAVHIVPVMPAITCMKELKSLKFLHQGSDSFNA